MLYSRELDISVMNVTVLLYTKLFMSTHILFSNDHLFLFPRTCYTVDWHTPTQYVSCYFE